MLQFARLALLAYTATIPLDVWAVPGIGSVSTAAGIALVGSFSLAALTCGYLRPASPPILALVVFVGWGALSYFWSRNPDATMQRVGLFVQLAAVTYIMWQLILTKGDVDNVVMAFTVGALIAAAATLVSYASGTVYNGEARYAASGYDPNDLGVTIAISLPLATYAASSRKGLLRAVAVACWPCGLAAIVLTGSRGATVAAAAGLLVLGVGLRRSPVAVCAILLCLAAVASLPLIGVLPAETWERLWTVREELSSGTLTHRTDIWAAGVSVFKDNWVTGTGAGSFPFVVQPILNWYIVAHNTFIGVATELGIVGAALFVYPLGWFAIKSRRIDPRLRRTLASALFTWAVGASSLSWEGRKTTWLLFGIAIAALAAKAPSRLGSGARVLAASDTEVNPITDVPSI
jgi:O-antigen ligase